MAFSVNALSASSSSNINCPDGKKSLFLLKKITELTKLGCKVLNKKVLNNTAGDLIHTYLTLPQQDSDSIKKELQGLKLVLPVLSNYNLNQVFHAALSEITGIDYSKNQETHLNQIYTEQFLTWIQEEIDHLPDFSILSLLYIYHGFSDPSIEVETSAWQELLSLTGWSASQIKSLNQFKSKYESLNFPFIKKANIMLSVEATGDIKKLKDLYILWSKVIEPLGNHLDKDQKKYTFRSMNKHKKFLGKEGDVSNKEFIIHTKKIITNFLPRFEQAIKKHNEKISDNSIALKLVINLLEEEETKLQNVQKKIEGELQDALKEINDQMQKIQESKNEGEYLLGNLEQLKRRETDFTMAEEEKKLRSSIEKKDQNLQELSKLKEEVVEKLEESQQQERLSIIRANNPNKQIVDLLEKKERDKKEIHNTLTVIEKRLSSILFLSQWIINLLEKEERLINQLEQEKRIAYEASIKKSKNFFKERSPLSKKSPVKSRSFVEDFSITSENASEEESEEEPSISSFSESSDSVLENMDSPNEIDIYVTELKEGKNTQISGLLSRTVDSLLKTLNTHLLGAKVADELKELYNLQAKEVYDHLLLGAAGLELIIQAIHDQRTDHVVLGFRTALLHCYYAMEQKLSQEIILETNQILDKADQGHNLLHLAQRAKIADIKKWEQFLQEMTLYLSFSYPEDYRLFFRQEHEQEAFSLLEDLSGPNLDKKKIEEALGFCFEMYSKSIAFITEASSAHIEDQSKLLHVMQELKKQTIKTLHEASTKKILLNQALVTQLKELDPVLMKVQQMLRVLHPFLKDFNLLSACEKNQRIYAAMGTVQSYLKFMQISLEIPQNSTQHSLQKFIKLETMTNIDKLFKHLFRAVILLESGEDNHLHTLTNLFPMVANFYKKDDDHAIQPRLKEMNLGISHHYLHIAWNNSELHPIYNESLAQAYSLLNVSNEYTAASKKIQKSTQGFQKNIGKINELVSRSLDLFMEFLEPTLDEIKERISITAVA